VLNHVMPNNASMALRSLPFPCRAESYAGN
jgi:hypothetical protein